MKKIKLLMLSTLLCLAFALPVHAETLTKDTDYTVDHYDNINAGTGKIMINGTGNYKGIKNVFYNINKAQCTITTAPTAKTLTCNGSQELIIPGTAGIGTIKYRLGETGEFSETIPTASAPGTYTVFYKSFTDNLNYVDSAVQSITVTYPSHTSVADDAVSATCTATGKTAGSHCSVCNTVLTAQGTTSALGHTGNEGGTVTQSTSCTANGVRYYRCTRCHSDYGGTYVYESAWGHDYSVKDDTKSMGMGLKPCQLKYGYKCSRCGTLEMNTSHYYTKSDHSRLSFDEWKCDNCKNYWRVQFCIYCGFSNPDRCYSCNARIH